MDVAELIELGDPDELLREIDRLCDRRAWNDLLDLRRRCHLAVERGKQLWGVAAHAEYRLALQAPADVAAEVIESQPGRFALGPLPEVAASTHEWHELGRSMIESPLKAITAYERVVRGEDLSSIPEAATYEASFEMPLALAEWEPSYALAEYRDTEVRFPAPELSVISSTSVRKARGTDFADADVVDALRTLAQAWTDESNGRSTAVGVYGGPAEALGALGVDVAEVHRISAQSAIAWMAWAASSGGAHGRRAGAAAGRSKTWWALAAVAGMLEDWPLRPDELGEYVDELQFFTWGDLDHSNGWSLRLLFVDPTEGATFAVSAEDQA